MKLYIPPGHLFCKWCSLVRGLVGSPKDVKNGDLFSTITFADLEVPVESDSSSVSLDGAKESSDDDSCTAPLSPKERVTDI